MKYSEIRTFGTSFTEGGGFEYWRKPITKQAYKGFTPMVDNTHFEFSWPGQLDKLVDCKISNYAKSGHGNERIYRLVYDMVSESDFEKWKDSTLFLFEFSSLGRKAIYSTELKKYGIYNYQIDWKNGGKFKETEGIHMAFDYYEDEYEENESWKWILKNYETITDYLRLTVDGTSSVKKVHRNIASFLSFCDSVGLNYYVVEDESAALASNHILRRWIPKYLFDGEYGKFSMNGPHGMLGHGMTITEETDEFIKDGHNGYFGNIAIAKKVANQLLKNKDIDKVNEVDFPSRDEIKKRVMDNISKIDHKPTYNLYKPKLI